MKVTAGKVCPDLQHRLLREHEDGAVAKSTGHHATPDDDTHGPRATGGSAKTHRRARIQTRFSSTGEHLSATVREPSAMTRSAK